MDNVTVELITTINNFHGYLFTLFSFLVGCFVGVLALHGLIKYA